MRCVRIEKLADHSLVLRVVFLSLALEEFDAAFAQRDRDLDPFFPEDEILRRRKKVRYDLQSSQWFVGVSDFRAHKFACPFASNRRQVSE